MMLQKCAFFAIATMLAFALQESQASEPGGRVLLKLERFSNPRGRCYNPRMHRDFCCDRSFWLRRCTRKLDPYFIICVKLTQGANKCTHVFETRTFKKKNLLEFSVGDALDDQNRQRNPLAFGFSRWKGFLSVRITIKDQDYPSRDDFVDGFLIQRSLPPSSDGSNARWHTFSRTGKTSEFRTSFSVQCNKNYYGPECSMKCQQKDNIEGHYTCDEATGRKICLPGWHGVSCRVPCVPHNDNVNGHYTCDATTGSKTCLPGWHGDRCNIYCRKTPTSICDGSGKKYCLPNWYGKDCSKYCAPTGNFACNSLTGERGCVAGWYGDQCDRYCIATHDDTAAFSCSETGEKVCHKGWYGTNCERHCVRTRNSVCSNITGERICNKGWHGVNCDTYCMPRNDQNAAYSCDKDGKKACFPLWYGSECDVFCIPSPNGHYTCNKETGAKICAPGWSGVNCNQNVCSPRNDNSAGYKCDGNGNRVCLKNWYPEGNCTLFCQQPSPSFFCHRKTGRRICRPGWYPDGQCDVYCLPRDDISAAYRCDPVSGEKSCKFGWYGPQCDCSPKDDKTAGYTCDKLTGVRVCQPGWTGFMCDSRGN
ncbi:multiple epidermal growth factor-like domains protein 11 [Nematostella vectensis]|uniref:multiple epidermal growth factor-like domains protein 11 n=1 Tax=Nematostella vectensis TaxID=45351 RepID=UPI00138FDB11|nr:multiple epidermal growth factor-like domains protein 11 [Nematostella vectensis]